MRYLLILALLVVASVVHADPFVGQSVVFKEDSTHSYLGVVVDVIDSDEVDLVLFGHDTLWYAQSVVYTTGGTPVLYLDDITRGSGNGQWLENPAAGSLITTTSTPSLTLNGSGVQFSTTRDAELSMSVSFSLPLSLAAGATGTVHLLCDSGSTPTTEVETLSRGNTGGLLTTDTSTLLLHYRVHAADYCRVTTTQDVGSPTFSIVRQRLQLID